MNKNILKKRRRRARCVFRPWQVYYKYKKDGFIIIIIIKKKKEREREGSELFRTE